MQKHVSLELSQEQQGQRARIGGADRAGLDGAREVFAEDADRTARRDLLIVRIEWDDQRRRVHLHRDRGADDGAEKREHATGEIAQHVAGIGCGIERRQRHDEVGDDDPPRAHGRMEESLLGVEVPQDCGRRDVECLRDVGKRRGREPARTESGAGSVEDLFARDARRSAHL
jgi:hypothetical protein